MRQQNQNVPGIVTAALPNTMFRIQLPDGKEILATVAGRMRKNFIKIMPGDSVTVEMTPYDKDRGRIVWRQ